MISIDRRVMCQFVVGSWRPIGHMRPSSPLLDSVRDPFEDYDTLAKDFTKVFLNISPNIEINAQLFDVVFMVGQSKQKVGTHWWYLQLITGPSPTTFQIYICMTTWLMVQLDLWKSVALSQSMISFHVPIDVINWLFHPCYKMNYLVLVSIPGRLNCDT